MLWATDHSYIHGNWIALTNTFTAAIAYQAPASGVYGNVAQSVGTNGGSTTGGEYVTVNGTTEPSASWNMSWSLNGVGARGISSTGIPSANLCGQATCTGGGGASFSYMLPNAEADASYRFVLTPVSNTGAPAAGSNRVLSVSKTPTAVTITLEADPGSGNSITFDWHLAR
jgi:hypothetical protein